MNPIEKVVREWEAAGHVGLPPGIESRIVGHAGSAPPADLEVLTVEQMATWLRVHEVTILQAAKKGQIPGRKVGRSWRFLRSEINEYLKGPPTLAAMRMKVQRILDTIERKL